MKNQPLYDAIVASDEATVRRIISEDRKAANTPLTEDGFTPLGLALGRSTKAVINCLLEGGANAKEPRLLEKEVHSRNIDLVSLLIHHGADVNAKNKVDQTLLHKIAISSHNCCGNNNDKDVPTYCAMIDMLVRNGADVNARDKHGRTPLHYVPASMSTIAETLIGLSADVNAKDESEKTPPYTSSSSHTRRVENERSAGAGAGIGR